MSTTSAISNETKLILAAQDSAQAAARSSTSSTSSSSASTANSALSSLAKNYTTFLTLLTTQLQHQDPSSPMSTDSFTTQLAQFTGVEQQVETNEKLSSLISLNESSQLNTASDLVGQTATATTTSLPLQNGSASLSFTGTSGESVAIAVANAAGTIVKNDVVTASSGTNTWTWDGKDNSGNTLANGAYNVAVKTIDSARTTSDVTFTVNGTITAVTKGDSDMNVEMGSVTVPMTNVSNISSKSSSSSSSSTASSSTSGSSSTTGS